MDVADVREPVVAEALGERRHTFTRQLIQRLWSDPSAIVAAPLAPLIARYPPNAFDLSALNEGPSAAHWLGVDYLGRDLWSRVIYGGRTSLPAGLGVVVIALGIGAPFGLIAGYAGRLVDDVIMRLMDCLLAFPGILLAIGIVAILGPTL